MNEPPQIIGIARDHDGLVAALRLRLLELGTTFSSIDDLAGLPPGYVSRLFNRYPTKGNPCRGLGRISMGPLLGALGVELLVAVDHAQLERIRHRIEPTRWPAMRHERLLADAAAEVAALR
jgi:hypothetical protein